MYSLPLVKRDRVGIHSLCANACADDQPSDHARRDYDSAALQGLQHLTRKFTSGVREREDANRTREVGHLDEIQGVVVNTLKLHCEGAVGFIDWLDAPHWNVNFCAIFRM